MVGTSLGEHKFEHIEMNSGRAHGTSQYDLHKSCTAEGLDTMTTAPHFVRATFAVSATLL